MTHRIELGPRPEIDDPRGAAAARQARDYLGLPVDAIRTRSIYKLDMQLDRATVDRVRRAMTDPVLEESALGRLALPPCRWVVVVGFLPGVTDNLGHTARVVAEDVVGAPLPDAARVYTETLYAVAGETLSRTDVDRLARGLLANTLIHSIRVWPAGEYAAAPPALDVPRMSAPVAPRVEEIHLPASDDALLALSRQRTLSLSLPELRAIEAHYAAQAVQRRRERLGLPAAPTDVELEALAQTWSEHCKHKIFNAQIHYVDEHGVSHHIDSLFRTYIVGVTRQIQQQVDWLVSVFHDNAGVVRATPETNLVFKVETHNSPSALDPYGGAITGIVGVNRDPLGTGIGAALLTNVWGYCLADPRHTGEVPEGLLHPRRIRDGVHQGVIDGGNQSGIPYSRGFELFDPRYLGKPLVFCGTVGVMPARVRGQPSHGKEVEPGDHVVMVGGRIGKDGIHGATFSSEALHGQSPAQAVQIGDPITQKKMSDMLLEARDRGLYRTLTDNGAGGLSSSVGEMAQHSGGAELDLERAPLKYAGLHPWEILLSEAQERMTLAVPPGQVDQLLELARRREVEATVIGRFTDSGQFVIRHEGAVVGCLEMAFLHDGCPTMELRAVWNPPARRDPDLTGVDPAAALGDLLASLEICSKARRWRQYDHEVKGLSVVKPLVGVAGDVPSDATVMRVEHGRPEAVVLAEGIAPRLSDLDAGSMAACVVDLAVRRVVAAGARLGQLAALDNFCWPDPVQSESTPDGEHKLGQLVRACQALATMTRGLGVPCISGKDSMKNDSTRGGVKISIPPTLLLSTMGWIEDASRALDLVPGAPGLALYVLGETRDELGGSALLHTLGQHGAGRAPTRDPDETRALCLALQEAAAAGAVDAAHAPHHGGLGVSLALMVLASGLGLELDLDRLPGAGGLADAAALLFSESGPRFVVAARAGAGPDLEAILRRHGVAWRRAGRTAAEPGLTLTSARLGLELSFPPEELRARHGETLDVF